MKMKSTREKKTNPVTEVVLAEPEIGVAPKLPLVAEAEPGSRWQSADAFMLYLREIAETALISPQEEIVLARKIKRGDKAARETMIKANLRLVVKIARDYENYGLPLLDLINEGNIGLMKAVDRFDPKKGAKLSTYAAWWIKQGIRRAISDQSKTIRLPVHVGDKILHIRRAEARFQDLYGRMPTDDELSDELGMTAKRIAQYRKAAIRPSSLDAPLGDDDSSTVAEVVADEKAGTPYDKLAEKGNNGLVHEILPTLDAREQEILRARFGFDGEDEQTLEEIGQRLGVTRERIRQIQEAALVKLRTKIGQLEMVSVTE